MYNTFIELYEDGQLVEVVPYKIGFRRLELINKVMHLNGKRLVLVGVNRHEWNPKTGRAIGMEEMISDMNCIKRNNINAVRTCHYPDQIPWYYMCDEEGIYLMSETNLESHGSFQKVQSSLPVMCRVLFHNGERQSWIEQEVTLKRLRIIPLYCFGLWEMNRMQVMI